MIITIDGPAASGKSTIAKLVAQKVSFFYLNSGFLYRALSYIFLIKCNYTDSNLINLTKEDISKIVSKLNYHWDNNQVSIVFESQDIASYLKDPAVENGASIIATNLNVRSVLSKFQRKLTQNKNVVAEGRDCGTVVFPEAECKFFLTALQNVRALRWQKQQKKLGLNFSLKESLKDIHERDERDSSRKIAPLQPAKDAIIIDNSKLNIKQTLDKILDYLKLKK